MKIYEEMLQVRDIIERIENEDMSEEARKETIESLISADAERYLESLTASYKNQLAFANNFEVEAKKLMEKAKKRKATAEGTLAFIDSLMQTAGLKEFAAGVHELKYRKGSEVVEIDESELPKPEDAPTLYSEVPASWKLVDKPALKKLIKAGSKIPGVQVVRNPDSLKIE